MDASQQFYQDVLTAIEQHHLLKALTHLKAWISTLSNWELSSRYEEIFNAYQSLLHFYAEGINDEKRFEMQEQFIRQTYSLNEATLRHVMFQSSSDVYYQEARKVANTNLETLKNDLENKQQQLVFSELTGNSNSSYATLQKERQEIANNLFFSLWTSAEWTQNAFDTGQKIFQSTAINQDDKSLFVSALMLALNHSFDVRKLILLIQIYLSEKSETSERALISIVFTFIIHQQLISSFVDHNTCPELNKAIRQLISNEDFCNNITKLQIQLINEQDTEKTEKEIENHIMPNIIKSGMVNGSSIKLDDIEELLDEDNDFQFLDKEASSKFNDSIQHLIALKQNGADLYFSSFRHLKSFSFFNSIANWFRPFSEEQPDVASFVKDDGSLLQTILDSDSLCSSDIYSILMMFNGIPKNEKEMMCSQINAMVSEKFKGYTKTNIPIQTEEESRKKYLQDCYRFFKLYRLRKEFTNPFDFDVILTDNHLLHKAFTTDATLKLAKFAAKQKYWNRLLAFLKDIDIETADNDTAMLKGMALQNTGQYSEAADYFSKAYSLREYDEQLARLLAHCLRITNQPEKASQIYAQLSEHLPENGKIAYFYGLSLMDAGQNKNAIKQFQKAYYLKPEYTNSLRALAWTYLISKESELAETQYQKLLADNPTADDYLNAGHTSLVMGNIKTATERYLSYHRMHTPKTTLFSIPVEDIKKLQDIYGIYVGEIQLITDYINSQEI